VGRVGGVEEAVRRLIGVGVPARAERGEDPAELREGDQDIGMRGQTDLLGFG
jgi:hypothetical protein